MPYIAVFKRLSGAFLRWQAGHARRRAARELTGFSDAQLLDLGITRAQIPAYVDGTHRKAGQTEAPRPRGRTLRLVVDNGPVAPATPCCAEVA